ncbi:MAG: hypothetical protein KatS3mg110_2449 [Pirellulaceae bacterium]|nr:MAG: hypothetical protein KatS3mg110_2449 [Pirellulaceae bacterium]
MKSRTVCRTCVRSGLVVLVALIVPLPGQSVAATDQAAVDFVLEGIAQRASTLRKGWYRAEGRLVVKENAASSEADVDGKCSIESAFDFDARAVRVVWEEPAKVFRVIPEINAAHRTGADNNSDRPQLPRTLLPERPARVEPWRGFEKSYYVSRGRESAYTREGLGTITLNAPPEKINRRILPFDVRAVGLYFWHAFENRASFDDVLGALRKQKSLKVTRTTDGLHVLSGAMSTSDSMTIIVDTTQGFVPIRSEWLNLAPSGKVFSRQYSTSRWEIINDTWVPVEYQVGVEWPDLGKQTELHLQFTWLLVNEPLDESLFSYRSFPNAEVANVVEYRGGQLEMVRLSPQLGGRPQLPRSGRPAPLFWIGNGGAAIVLLLLVVWWWKRRRK